MATDVSTWSRTGGPLARFALVAGGGWLLDAACLLLLSRLIPAGFANVASSLTAASLVYLVAHHYVHDGRPALVGLRLGAYALYTLVLILIASATLAGLVRLLGPYASSTAALIAAKVLITPPQFLCNFVVSRSLARAPIGGSA